MSSEAPIAVIEARVAPGAEALAFGAVRGLWRARTQIWPLWLGAVAFIGYRAFTADGPKAGASLLDAMTQGWGSALVAEAGLALASALAIRILLGRGRESFLADRPLAAYVAVLTLMGFPPVMLVAGLSPPGAHASPAEVKLFLNEVALLIASLALAGVAMLRLTLWPVARLLGRRDVSPERSWRLMRGATGDFLFATIVLTAPLGILGSIPLMLSSQGLELWGRLWAAPIGASAVLLVSAVAAEVYQSRIGLLDEAPADGVAAGVPETVHNAETRPRRASRTPAVLQLPGPQG